MQFEVEINGRLRPVVVQRADGRFVVTVDGREWVVDAARVDAHTLSLLLTTEEVRLSREVTIAATSTGSLMVGVGPVPLTVSLNGRRRWGRQDEGAAAGGGPQRILAPMPGRIARVLVRPGEAVRARQPIVVIEAMKMENEMRAPGAGTVAELHVQEGQLVEANTLLAVIAQA